MVKNLDFICIGAGKSGTTSIYRYLRHHPSVFLPAVKEDNFFSMEDRYRAGWPAYAAVHFGDAPDQLIWGLIHPRYMGPSAVPQRIRSLMPDVRLFALLRNPVDAVHSYYRMKARTGSETRSFDQAIREQLNPEALERARSGDEGTTVLDTYVMRREYGRILAGYLNHFGTDQVAVYFTEHLKHDPQSVLDQICQFIGLQPGFTPPNLGKRYFVGGNTERFPWLVPALQRSGPIRLLWHRLPHHRRRRLVSWFRMNVNVKPSPPEPMTDDLHQELVDFFAPDVRCLEDLLRVQVPWPEFHEQGTQAIRDGRFNKG